MNNLANPPVKIAIIAHFDKVLLSLASFTFLLKIPAKPTNVQPNI